MFLRVKNRLPAVALLTALRLPLEGKLSATKEQTDEVCIETLILVLEHQTVRFFGAPRTSHPAPLRSTRKSTAKRSIIKKPIDSQPNFRCII